MANFETIDFANTVWGKILLDYLKENLKDCILSLEKIKKDLEQYAELSKFFSVITNDIEQLEEIQKNLTSWDQVYEIINQIKFATWPTDKKVTLEIKEKAKEKRDRVKKQYIKLKEKIVFYSSKEANQDLYEMYKVLKPLKNLIIEFMEKFQSKKREKNIIDFHDIEHFALEILLKKENGKYIPTEAAKRYQEKFVEIAIDEYQDSNLVQEYILTTISNGKNVFMVGDVKQSIYKFRQARPELFLEKYNAYKLEEDKKEGEDLKIQLFKNFRSRKNVLDITNLIFQNIMSQDLGDIEYAEDEYLNLGAGYPEDNPITELNMIDLKKDAESEEEDDEGAEVQSAGQDIEPSVLEAKLVAKRMKELIEGKYQVYDKKGYRDITYKDIVILLRATANIAPIYEKELFQLEIPVFSDSSAEYLESIEIQTIISLLKIIDNPIQDIPLVSVLRSSIADFNDDELVKIRLCDKNCSFYESLQKFITEEADSVQVSELQQKVQSFLQDLQNWRKEQEYLSLDEFIWKLYIDTGYYNYVGLMPNGKLRQANLKMLFEKAKEYERASFKGLFAFINFIERLKSSSNDMSAAKIIGENENVVRIMSIHKSKGLEFPIVFLCNTKKTFNMMDLNQNILLHQDLGIGPKYISYERKIEYNTLAKEALKITMEKEIIGEEMRLLYVALTRAKEKLIITGTSKNLEKELGQKEELLHTYQLKDKNKINKNFVQSYKSYLDWLEMVYLKNKDEIEDTLQLKIYEKKDIITNKEENTKEKKSIFEMINAHNPSKEERNQIEEYFSWKYPYEEFIKLPNKTSVTKLKELKSQSLTNRTEEQDRVLTPDMKIPQFLKDQKITNARVGTLVHMCLQRLNEKIDYHKEQIEEMLSSMVVKEIITKEEANHINIDKLLQFTKSKIWEELKHAKQIYREKPFYITLPAADVFNNDIETESSAAQVETILVQGIIDLYYINHKDELILVDYKTDSIKDEKELVHKYQSQLQLYKQALESALNKKVDDIYIYSTHLDKEMKVEI